MCLHALKAREVKLLSSALYHGLSTGLGRPTLGEEYCGIDQVAAGEWRAAGGDWRRVAGGWQRVAGGWRRVDVRWCDRLERVVVACGDGDHGGPGDRPGRGWRTCLCGQTDLLRCRTTWMLYDLRLPVLCALQLTGGRPACHGACCWRRCSAWVPTPQTGWQVRAEERAYEYVSALVNNRLVPKDTAGS